MNASVVVLTHNRIAALRECLMRIYANTVDRTTEVIVIENGCTDSTAEWLDANTPTSPLKTRVIHRPTNEGVAARNWGIEAACGEYILQCDDDVMPMAGWDQVLLAPMLADPTIGGTGQEAFYQEQSWSRKPWSAGLIDDRRRPAEGQCADLLMGFAWAFRNLRHSDGSARFLYNTEFDFWHEEALLQIEIRAAGYRLMKTRAVAAHRSLPHIRSHEEDIVMAEQNFQHIKSRWQNDPRLTFEGEAVGLR